MLEKHQDRPLFEAFDNPDYHGPKGGVKLQILFEEDGEPKLISIESKKSYLLEFSIDLHNPLEFNANANVEINDKLKLNSLFYSILINYSHHGLNSLHVGNWINSLFHKNDGYQTPIVLNPMRTEGKIDINKLTYLSIFKKTKVKKE